MKIFWWKYKQKILFVGIGLFCICIGLIIVFSDFLWNNTSPSVLSDNQSPVEESNQSDLNMTQAQADIFDALSCAKSLQSNSSFSLDSELTTQAQQLKQIYSTVTVSEQIKMLEPYDWYLVGPVFFKGDATSGCGWQDFDTSNLDIGHIGRVGIALSPPDSYAPASVLILGKEK